MNATDQQRIGASVKADGFASVCRTQILLAGLLFAWATPGLMAVDEAYVRISVTKTDNAPSPRGLHTAVWTGSEMIVWGGGATDYGTPSNDGARFLPAANIWISMTTNGAPAVRKAHSAVWTGNEMLVWGGVGMTDFLVDGGRYNPVTDSWVAIVTNGAPTGREFHETVWTGSELMVWGGWGGYPLGEGGRYNLASNTWTTMTTNGAPAPRMSPSVVWTGASMIIWGGYVPFPFGGKSFNDGGRYDPLLDAWQPIALAGAPAARASSAAVWTGTEMIVWSGIGYYGGELYDEGARYSPARDQWTTVTSIGVPTGRAGSSAVWTGHEMVVWGGFYTPSNDGGLYNPDSDSWRPMTAINRPATRINQATIWTGTEMIMWGGDIVNTGGRYNPVTDTWVPTPVAGTNAVRLSWPDSTNHWVLQENADLSTTNWSVVAQTPVTSGTNKTVIVPISSAPRFYRLLEP